MKPWKLAPAALIVCSLVYFPACAKKKKEEVQPITVPTLTGDYVTQCSGATGISSFSLVRFDKDPLGSGSNMMMRVTEEYAGNTCNAKTATTRVYYKFTMGAAKNATLFEINFDETEYLLTPETPEVAANWSRVFRCGISNWASGQERAIDKASGCVPGDTIRSRRIHSILKLEGNNLTLGKSVDDNAKEDGLIPERRYTALEATTYVKRPTATPVDPVNPTPVAGCPDLSGAYACHNGDLSFAGKNVNVANILGVSPRLIIQMTLSQTGKPSTQKSYVPNEPERTKENDGYTVISREQCELIGNVGKLRSFEKMSRTGDTRQRLETERVFEMGDINGRKTLVINTATRDVTDDRPSREEKQRTECIKL